MKNLKILKNKFITIQEILKRSVTGKSLKLIDEIDSNLYKGIYYPNVLIVNDFLNNISECQCNLLIKKFKGIHDIYKMNDKLTEILCAVKYRECNPKFLEEGKEGNPDLYLKKTKEYIEVKRINKSNKEKKLDGIKHYTQSASIKKVNKEEDFEKLFSPLRKKLKKK